MPSMAPHGPGCPPHSHPRTLSRGGGVKSKGQSLGLKVYRMTLGFSPAPPHTTPPPLLPNIPNIRRPTTLARRQAHKQKEQGKALPFNDMLGVIGGQAGHPRRDYVAPWMALHKPTWTYLRRVPERMTRLPSQQHPPCQRFGFGFGFGSGSGLGF